MFFGFGRLSCPGGTSVVGLADALGFGVGDAGADGCGAGAVRATVTAVPRGAGGVEVSGFADVAAGSGEPARAAGVPVLTGG